MIVKRLIFLLSILMTTQAMAVELSLEECVQLGVKQNENLKALEAEIEISNQDAKIAYAELFPSLSLEGSYLVRDQPPHFTLESGLFGQGLPPNDANVEGEKEHYTVGVRLRQPLFTGGRLSGTHQKQNVLVEARRYHLEDQKSRLIYQIKRSFYQALSRQHEFAGTTEKVLSQTEELRNMQELLLAGKVTKNEVSVAKSRLLFSEAAVLQVEQTYQNALDDLGSLIGMDGPLNIKESITYSTLSPDFENIHDVSLNGRKDVKQLDAQVDAANEEIQVARSVYYPQLSLEASYLKQRETDITEDDIWEAGVWLDWSLFDAGKTTAEVAKAKAEHLRLKHLRKDLERSAINEVKSALRLVRENELLVEAHKHLLLATEQEHSHNLELYHSGKYTKQELSSSRAKIMTSNANYLAAINHLRTSLVGLETALSAPIENKLIAHEIYQPNLEKQEPSSAEPAPSSPKAVDEITQTIVLSPYSIQLGAFRSEEKATLFTALLEKKFPKRTFEIISAAGWSKVRATQLASQEAAEAALVEFGGKGIIVHAKPDNAGTD